ncbi:MAG: hypothetical protein WKF71_08755 [Pyrinomonadaceae bacterium]
MKLKKLETINIAVLRFFILVSLLLIASISTTISQTKPRARDLGVPFEGVTGQFNAITDVKGVEVGYTTLISGDGKKRFAQA